MGAVRESKEGGLDKRDIKRRMPTDSETNLNIQIELNTCVGLHDIFLAGSFKFIS